MGLTARPTIPSSERLRIMLKDCVFGVGERLHFGIALISSGIPCVMLGYQEKHWDYAEAIGAERYVVPLSRETSSTVQQIQEEFADSQFELPASTKQQSESLREKQLILTQGIADALCPQALS
jgi:polysaccharide pyruvyl transferase WcaK-like protein